MEKVFETWTFTPDNRFHYLNWNKAVGYFHIVQLHIDNWNLAGNLKINCLAFYVKPLASWLSETDKVKIILDTMCKLDYFVMSIYNPSNFTAHYQMHAQHVRQFSCMPLVQLSHTVWRLSTHRHPFFTGHTSIKNNTTSSSTVVPSRESLKYRYGAWPKVKIKPLQSGLPFFVCVTKTLATPFHQLLTPLIRSPRLSVLLLFKYVYNATQNSDQLVARTVILMKRDHQKSLRRE